MAAKKTSSSSASSKKGSAAGLAIGVLVGLSLLGGAIYGLATLEKRSATDGGAASASASASASTPSAPPSSAPSAPATASASAAPVNEPLVDAASTEDSSVQDATTSSTDATTLDAGVVAANMPATDRFSNAKAELETASPTLGLARGERPGKATKEAIAFAEEICAAAASGVAQCAEDPKTKVVVSIHALEKDGYIGHEARVVPPAGAKPGAKDGGASADGCMVQEVLKVLDTRLDADRGSLTDLEGRAFFTCTFGGAAK